MEGDTYGDQVARATAFTNVFPDQLGRTFRDDLDVNNFPKVPNVHSKFEFVKLVAGRGLNPEEAAELWHLVHPDDDAWSRTPELLGLLRANSARSKELAAGAGK